MTDTHEPLTAEEIEAERTSWHKLLAHHSVQRWWDSTKHMPLRYIATIDQLQADIKLGEIEVDLLRSRFAEAEEYADLQGGLAEEWAGKYRAVQVENDKLKSQLAGAVDVLRKYENPDAWGTWDSVKSEYIDDGKEWLYGAQGALLARYFLKTLPQAAEAHNERIRQSVIERLYGPRCPDYDPDCIVCTTWELYDEEFNNGGE